MFNKLAVTIFGIAFLTLISCSKETAVQKREFIKNNSKDMVLLAGGDLICASYVENAIKKYGPEHPFKEVKEHIEKADISFANLECVISDKGGRRSKKINYGSSLASLDSIVYSGIDVFSIANNHVYDMGRRGLLRFNELLDRSPVYYGGAGRNKKKAGSPVTVQVNGLKVSFLFYDMTSYRFCAKEKNAGYNCLGHKEIKTSIKQLEKDIETIKNSDIKIMSVHWGPNYTNLTSEDQIKLAHFAIDNGIDVVLGHSAHIFHGIEIYKNRPVIYDMGDLLINDVDGWDSKSFLYYVHIVQGKVKFLELVPIYMPNSQIRIAEGALSDEIVARMLELSGKFNTQAAFSNNRIIINVDSSTGKNE